MIRKLKSAAAAAEKHFYATVLLSVLSVSTMRVIQHDPRSHFNATRDDGAPRTRLHGSPFPKGRRPHATTPPDSQHTNTSNQPPSSPPHAREHNIIYASYYERYACMVP